MEIAFLVCVRVDTVRVLVVRIGTIVFVIVSIAVTDILDRVLPIVLV